MCLDGTRCEEYSETPHQGDTGFQCVTGAGK